MNPLVETLYYTYLRFCLNFTALVFGSGQSAHGLKRYFINALEMLQNKRDENPPKKHGNIPL